MKPKIKNIFDWLNEMTLHKTSSDKFTEGDWGLWNTYMVHRFVSMNKDYIELVNYIQTIPYENKEQIYNIYKEMLPTRKEFFRYIKTGKKIKNRELLRYVSEYFECSLREADENIQVLQKSELTTILTSMGVEEKEQKIILKS